MTASLNCQFKTALGKRDSWGPERVRSALCACKEQIPQTDIDWDEGDENWGRLVQNGEIILLINALIPLAFVLSNHRDTVQKILGDCAAVVVESFSSEDFSIDGKLLEQIVGHEVSSNVDYDQLSIDDLWWATV